MLEQAPWKDPLRRLPSQVTTGTAREEHDFGGRSGALEADTATRTDIPDVATVRSAKNDTGSGQVIRSYSDLACQLEVAERNPGQSDKGGYDTIIGAVAYTATPA